MYEYGKAMPTTYNGCDYRSRLESNIAKILDDNKIKFQYEKKNFLLKCGHYLPDFFVSSDWFIEGKGEVTVDAIEKCRELSEKGFKVLIITPHCVEIMQSELKKGMHRLHGICFYKGKKIFDYPDNGDEEFGLFVINGKIEFIAKEVYVAGCMKNREYFTNIKNSIQSKEEYKKITLNSPHIGGFESKWCSSHSDGCMRATIEAQECQIDSCDIFIVYLNRDGLHGSIVECMHALHNGKDIAFIIDKNCPEVLTYSYEDGLLSDGRYDNVLAESKSNKSQLCNDCGECSSESSYWYLIDYCKLKTKGGRYNDSCYNNRVLIINDVDNGKLNEEQTKKLSAFIFKEGLGEFM